MPLVVWGGCHWDTIVRSATDCGADDAALAIAEAECLGGHAANAGTVITALGGRAALRTVVGDDAPGRAALAALRSAGVGTGEVLVAAGVSTGRAYVVNEPSAKRMWVRPARSAGADVASLWAARPGPVGAWGPAALVMDVPLPLEDLVERVPAGTDLIWAPGPFVSERLGGAAQLQRVAVVVLNAAEQARACASPAWRKATAGTTLVVTHGRRGCTVQARGEHFEVAATPRREVDASGAGDAFAAALAWAI
ncbi:MAG TPA: PfkB family carbohydrate kinase, partial [Solirubrobacterales bacterium]|nr:PfkB family carbohydrate kinase [Solirubrobacterales bacterium]